MLSSGDVDFGGSAFAQGHLYDYVQLSFDLGGNDCFICRLLSVFQPAENQTQGMMAKRMFIEGGRSPEESAVMGQTMGHQKPRERLDGLL